MFVKLLRCFSINFKYSEGRNTIPPNADLVFTIELIDITTQKAGEKQQIEL